MYRGKRCKEQPENKYVKPSVLMISVIALMVCIVGSTIAYIVATAGPLKNVFTPSTVSCAVVENIDGTTKKAVKIQNTGDTDAYIRAMVVVTWKDEDGNVYGKSQPVAGTDYTLTHPNGNNFKWTCNETDGFYYYNEVVPADKITGNLIGKCELKGTPPEGYTLSVEIIADAIQTNAVDTAWGYTPSGN